MVAINFGVKASTQITLLSNSARSCKILLSFLRHIHCILFGSIPCLLSLKFLGRNGNVLGFDYTKVIIPLIKCKRIIKTKLYSLWNQNYK